jgi:4-diphosphocytidyl-2-C-methyl-D-erythritol kinase
VAPASGLSLEIVGPVAASLEGDPDNLVLKAARLLAGRAGVAPRAAIRLTKRIPVAAGLGGGSADAAATLLALIELWRVAMPQEELFDLAATLGADVPMCLAGRPALASGIGERLAPAPALPACAILLVNPGVALPTPAVFGARRGSFSAAQPIGDGWPDLVALAEDLARRGNDLAAAAISLQPEIAAVLDRLKGSDGVAHVAMSGSGATCFGLYGTIEDAQRAASLIPASWWRHAGRLV